MFQNQWWIAYRDAALETDFNRLDDRIEAAERSMAERTFFGGHVFPEELRELKDSWNSLQVSKKYQLVSQRLGREYVVALPFSTSIDVL